MVARTYLKIWYFCAKVSQIAITSKIIKFFDNIKIYHWTLNTYELLKNRYIMIMSYWYLCIHLYLKFISYAFTAYHVKASQIVLSITTEHGFCCRSSWVFSFVTKYLINHAKNKLCSILIIQGSCIAIVVFH